MIEEDLLKKSLEMTRTWYRKSGIMVPADGSWGVGERVLLTENNSSRDMTLKSFPAWYPHPDRNYYIIEQRRADCCAEAALMFLLMHEVSGDRQDYDTGVNLLDFLFFRSGLLTRFGHEKETGIWNWSHIKREGCYWLDDNGWMAALLLKIAGRYPELEKKYELKKWGLKLADLLAEVLPVKMADHWLTGWPVNWLGNVKLPHWGSLVCQALAIAAGLQPKEEYRRAVEDYHRYLLTNADSFTSSEYGYALIDATAAYEVWKDDLSWKVAKTFADRLVAMMDPVTGNLPSMHSEAPVGKHLCDTIYTLNWAVLGFQNISAFDRNYAEPFRKIRKLLLDIQDRTPEDHLFGCWRGMYDFKTKSWGGGDCYEGGANSIYSGWTNAPIPWAMACSCLNTCLAEL